MLGANLLSLAAVEGKAEGWVRMHHLHCSSTHQESKQLVLVGARGVCALAQWWVAVL